MNNYTFLPEAVFMTPRTSSQQSLWRARTEVLLTYVLGFALKGALQLLINRYG